jgi:hypothetical protein
MSDYGKVVNFVLYWDGKELRCYIPNKGNTYSPKNDEEDEENDEEDEEIENEDENPVIDEEIFWGEVEKRFKE